MSIATASDLEMAPARPLLMPLLSATACVALADWLFYDWQIGISLALFLGVLGAVAVAGNRVYATRTVQIVMAAIFAAGLLALIEDVNVLSVILSTLATALFVIVMTARENSSWQWNLFEAAIAPLRSPATSIRGEGWRALYFSALDSRLIQTCLSSAGSPFADGSAPIVNCAVALAPSSAQASRANARPRPGFG